MIIGEKYKCILEPKLTALDIDVLWLPDNPCVDSRLSGHCDLSVIHLGGERVVLSEYLRGSEFEYKLREIGARIIYHSDAKSSSYPDDAAMNICLLGDKAILNPKSASKKLVNLITNDHMHFLAVKQGYTKCSTAIVGGNSIITADKTIANVCGDNGIDALYVNDAKVKLEGFDSGFIGGASFKIKNDVIAFTGQLDSSIRCTIEDFIISRSVTPICLTDDCIFDIGSAIPLTEAF